ncbi:MAG TPA: hypothetical protein VGL75_07460 [Acidothermaceae bacterium]|jgi:hypothetical protein
MLYIGLWNLADEHARLIGGRQYLKGQIFPYEPDLNDDAVARLREELVTVGVAVKYTVGGETYLFLPMLSKHQRLDPRVASKHPEPPAQIYADATRISSDESEEIQTDQPEDEPADASAQVSAPTTLDPDLSAPDPDKSALLYVAGSMEHVAGSMVGRRKRGTTLPDDFAVTDGMRAWAATEIPLVDADSQTAKFRDFHTAKGSTFKDWTAAWRTWMRNAQSYAERDGRQAAPQTRPPVSTDLEWMRGGA